MIAYKGFDKDLKCRDFQYEVGKEYEQEGEISVCGNGFHACEIPLDVFSYYPPTGNRFCEVEQSGEMSKDNEDSKVASQKIKIGAEIGIPGIIRAHIEWVKKTCESAAGRFAASGHAAAQGNRGHAAAQGDWGHAEVRGKNAIAAAFGIAGAARAALDSWIMCAEWEWNGEERNIKDVKAAKIDGEKLKADTWYGLKDGSFVEVEK